MNYEIQFARVTNFGKLSERFLSCQHLKSEDLTKSSMGEIFSLMEILSPWYNSAQIGQLILNNFANNYWQGGSTSDLVNFENALKKVNENLAQITQNGETDWIGNLGGILATIVGDNILLSSTGKAEVYLFRTGKINHLTAGLADKIEVHPLKTFSNIISGQLKPHDKILIANKSLFEELNLESLHQIINLNSPSVAALQITKILRKSKVKNVNLIIINLFSKDESAGAVIKDNLENVFYLDKSTESVFGKVKSFWQMVITPVGKILGSIFKNVLNKIKSRRGRTKIQEKPKTDVFQKEFMTEDSRDDQLLKDEEIKYSPDLYVHYYQEKKLKKESKFAKILQVLKNSLMRAFKWLLALYPDPRRRKYFYLILALVLILIIGLVVVIRGHGKKGLGNLEAQKILNESIASQKEAKNFLIAGSSEKAKEKFLESIEKAQSSSGNALVAKDAEAVVATSFQELDKLTSTTRFSKLDPALTIAESGKGIFIVSGEAFIVTESDIYKANILSGKPQKVASIPKNKGNFVAGVNLGNLLYLYTSDQNLFEFDPSSGKVEPAQIAADGRWETANALSGYVSTLYLLDGVVGQIYKHSSNKDIFDKGEEYTASKNSLKNSLSLTIDGSIYVLKNDGQAVKFQRSKLQDFSLKNIPTPWDKITEPRKIFTDSNTPSLYVLDAGQKRILEFDKEGVFVHQYAFPASFNKISDFTVSIKSKKIWLLNDKSLYEITI